MRKFKIICVAQIHNELEKGNLERFIKYVMPLVDNLVVYDDGSTDGSYEYLSKHTKHIIRGSKNEFEKEMYHKNLLLKKALKLKPDFIFYLDCDEVFSAGGRQKLELVCDWVNKNDLDGASFHKLNLWRSRPWRRVDSLYDIGWFVHLWKVTPGMKYTNLKKGLHHAPYPTTVKKIERNNDLFVIHYGFSDFKNLSYKYLTYKNHGQRGYSDLERLVSEKKLKLKKVPKNIFPKGLWKNDSKPEKMSYENFMLEILKFRKNPVSPKYTIIGLIYKSTDWLKFSYSQLSKYTDLTDCEVFYVANDATGDVLSFLKKNKIPHYIFNNTPKQRKQWYINNVYRAHNFGAKKAKGEILIFINSDMAFSNDWLPKLAGSYDGKSAIVSRMVESGKLPSGKHAISKNFGREIKKYIEEKFNIFARKISVNKILQGGIYGPLFINKSHFLSVGGYPEGNVVKGSDIFNPKIANRGDDQIPGDEVFMRKLKTKGIIHKTVFNSIVYHFQEGEKDVDKTILEKLNIRNRLRKVKNKIYVT